jgi:hypothetical protein
MSAFDSDKGGDLTISVDPDYIVGGEGHFQIIGIPTSKTKHEVDLLEGHLERVLALIFRGDPNGPELAANTPGAQARDVGLHRFLEDAGILGKWDLVETVSGNFPNLPGCVVMAIDQGDLSQELVHLIQ